jgi:hypothetical protein
MCISPGKITKTQHIMYAVELAQAGDRLEIQTDAMSRLLLGLRMSLAVMMENHYSFGAEVVASHYRPSD